jgi:hypothetical protein
MALIKRKTNEEGEVFIKWLDSRLIRQNKNVISAELGPTGSGKSYRDLRKAELWYDYHFKEKFPEENICFGVGAVMKLISTGKLRRGEIIIFEEGGINLGSRGWQSKVSQMFNHILQSFRSLNLALFMNLPYLSMLDSQARHLLHYYAESSGIDQEKGLNKCKPFFVQVAQGTGKIYRHYPKVKADNKLVKIKRFNWSLPSQYLIDAYESKKGAYLKQLIVGYSEKTNGKVEKPDAPKKIEFKAYGLYEKGVKQVDISKQLGKAQQTVSNYINNVKKWYESLENKEKFVGIRVLPTTKPILPTTNMT